MSLAERLTKTGIGLLVGVGIAWVAIAIYITAAFAETTPSAGPPSQPTVSIGTDGDHFCSGVYLGDSIVLTASHCVMDWTGSGIEKGLKVGYENQTLVPAYVELVDIRYDFALLRATPMDPVTSASLACRDPIVGEEVSLVGFPGDMEWVTTFGRVSSLYQGGSDRWPVIFVSDVASIGGNSGGPVFDAKGDILGILVGGPGQNFDAFSYVVPSSIICQSVNLSIS